MTESSRPEEVQAELLRADKSLAAARSLLKDDFLEDALSRAYYSILHAARAVLLAEGVSVSSHRAVRRLFGSHLIKPGKGHTRRSHYGDHAAMWEHQSDDLAECQRDRTILPNDLLTSG